MIALRLERFGAEPAPALLPPTSQDVDDAWHRGHEHGLAQGREASLDELTQELRRIGAALEQARDDDARIRGDALAAVTPVLAAIVDVLGPASARERLVTALDTELAQIARAGTPGSLVIRCAPDMRADVQDCLTRAGLSNATLDDGLPHPGMAQIRLQGGIIDLDPMQSVTGIAALVNELNHEE